MPNFVLDLLCMKNHINILIREYFPNREEMPDFFVESRWQIVHDWEKLTGLETFLGKQKLVFYYVKCFGDSFYWDQLDIGHA